MKLYAGAVLLFGASLFAQDVPPDVPQETPGADTAGPTEDEYGGPAILSRGGGPSITRAGELARIRPFLTLNGIYDSGLATTTLDENGHIPFRDGYGIESMFGATGTHTWRSSSLDLDYRGSLRHYTQNSFYDGFDNSLMLQYRKQVSPRFGFMLSESAGRYSRSFSLPMGGAYGSGALGYDPTVAGLTTNDLFDTPTTAVTSGGTAIYQLTARTSVSAGASGFLMRRRSQVLIGAQGYSAQGDISHRLTRYQTIGIAYSFGHFDFQNRYGQSDLHGVSLNYSIRIGRRWEAAFLGGAIRVESLRLIQVPLDPFIAAVLGQPYGVEKFHGVSYVPRFGVHITRGFRRATGTLSYDRSVLAGNGLYLTSGYQAAAAAFSYNGLRRVALQAGANWSQYSGLTQTLGRYRNVSASAGFSTRLSRFISLIGRIDGRRYYIQLSQFNHIYYRALLGFGITPGDFPLAIW